MIRTWVWLDVIRLGPQAHRIVDRLRELGRVTLLPGHGKPWTGQIADAIELARELPA